MRELLAAYPRAAPRFDEMLGADGAPRPHWAGLVEMLARAEPARMRDRIATIEREIRDSGLTYNMYADPKGAERPWALDALPMIIGDDEWAQIERGVAQRARLLDAVLRDLYGAQSLLVDGVIPPRLVMGHSAFQRPACGIGTLAAPPLIVYAADLARSPDGRWWVVADRTQAPSGAGYAIENRLIVSRIFPKLFRDLHTRRLAGFFVALRDALRDFAPAGDGPPLTVVLTPGPYNETYSEHSLLARYLGFTLVEGSDLTVRGGKVWLKTVDGLRRVHAILRRQDDDFCDPLELRSDSALGVPGLVDCARRGSVLMANAIGSGVLEGGALMGFLPKLSEHLLGEPLVMPSVATWWLGEPAALADALPRTAQLVFKPADPLVRDEPVFGMDLDAAGARSLAARIRRHPQAWIAQELVRLSQAPVYDRERPDHLAARAVGLRVFAVASRGGWTVMPGGLTRVASSRDARVVSMQRGGGSKDTWVLSNAPPDGALTLLRSTVGADELVRSGAATLSSRAAENLFWLGRYAERAEDAARLLRVALPRFSVDEDVDRPAQAPLLALGRALGVLVEADTPEAMLLDALYEADRMGGLRTTLNQVQRVAFSLRDRLSVDHWRTINRLLQDPGFDAFRELPQAMALLDRVVNGLVTLSGFALDGMTRDTGWRFLSLGRRIERLRGICAAVACAVREGRSAGLDWLLEFCDSSITYRSRYVGQPEWLPALDLVIRDDTNPRSVAFQTRGLAQVLERLHRVLGAGSVDLAPPVLVDLGPLDDPAALVPDAALADRLDAVADGAALLSDRLSLRFFAHADDRKHATFAA
ncbi:MAG: circularly permuted type 2 ATP-grasp protein [Burkholderiales bacterium]